MTAMTAPPLFGDAIQTDRTGGSCWFQIIFFLLRNHVSGGIAQFSRRLPQRKFQFAGNAPCAARDYFNSSGQLSHWSVEMKICIKTVHQETYLIDVEPTATVGALKCAIERHPEAQQYFASSQRLIFAGRILDDSSTIASLYLKENDFIVLMKRRNNNAQEV